MIKSQRRKTATATVTAVSWQEARYDAPEGQPALAQADFTLSYSGDIVGASSSRLLLAYTGGDPADPKSLVGDYVGYERVIGALDGRAGGFIVEIRGRHEDGVARSTGRIVPDSATGELAGLHGEVEGNADDVTYQVTLSYAFAPDPAIH